MIGATATFEAVAVIALTGLIVGGIHSQYKLFIDPYKKITIDTEDRFQATMVLSFKQFFKHHYNTLSSRKKWELSSTQSATIISFTDYNEGDEEVPTKRVYTFSTPQIDENTFYQILDHEKEVFSVIWKEENTTVNDTVINFYNHSHVQLLALLHSPNITMARQALFAITTLNPFVFKEEQKDEYSSLNIDDYSEMYLRDRSLMLVRITDSVGISHAANRSSFTDMTTGRVLLPPSNASKFENIIFGTNNGETLQGVNFTSGGYYKDEGNHLYGMGGDDTLIGCSGRNYLEGGVGYDTYDLSPELDPGEAPDIICDIDGKGKIMCQGKTISGLFLGEVGSDRYVSKDNWVISKLPVVVHSC